MNSIIVQIITAFIGSLGFGLMFNVRFKHLIPAALGGIFTWSIYLAAEYITKTVLGPTIIASAFAAIYAEILAKTRKSPANQYLIVALIPLIPGSSLYYTMSYAVQSKLAQFKWYGFRTFQYAIGIAIGISLVWALGDMTRRIALNRRKEVIK